MACTTTISHANSVMPCLSVFFYNLTVLQTDPLCSLREDLVLTRTRRPLPMQNPCHHDLACSKDLGNNACLEKQFILVSWRVLVNKLVEEDGLPS